LPGSAKHLGRGDILCFGYGQTSSLWSALTINIGTALLEIGVIPQKRAVGITASSGHPAKSLPSYSAWYLAGEVASVRRRVGGWQTRSEPKWPISVDYRMRKRRLVFPDSGHSSILPVDPDWQAF